MKRVRVRKIQTEADQDFFLQLDNVKQIEDQLKVISSRRSKVTISDKCQDLDAQAFLLNKLVLRSQNNKPLKFKYLELCETFGINFSELKKLPTIDAKSDYVVQCSSVIISKKLDMLMDKYTRIESIEKNSCTSKKLGLFGWLQVQSQYKKLKGLLNFVLVNLIQEDNNRLTTMKYFGNIHNQMHKRIATESQAYSDTNYTSRITQPTKIPEPLKLTIPITDFFNQNTFAEWNQAVEEGYIKCKKNLQQLRYDLISKQKNGGLVQSKEDKLLQKFEYGAYFTQEELQYLTSTSTLMQKCLDKQFIQRAINFLDKEVVNQIELNIADQTIRCFYNEMEESKQARANWLQCQNQKKRKIINARTKIFERQKEQHDNQKQIKSMKKKLINMLKDASKRKELKSAADKKKQADLREQRRQGDPLANVYVQKFKEKIMDQIHKIRENKITKQTKRQDFLFRNVVKGPPQIVYDIGKEQYDAQKSKRMFHPSSKLFTLPTELPSKEFKIDTKYNQQQVQKYKLGIRNPHIQQTQFQNFYSGGPQDERQYKSEELQFMNQKQALNPKHEWLTSQAELQAAIKIKAAFKKYIQKKRLGKLIHKREVLKNRDIENKIQKCLEAKQFFDRLHVELAKNKQITQLPDNNEQKNPTCEEEGTQEQVNQGKNTVELIIPTLPFNSLDQLATSRRAQEQVLEITRKKKLQKLSKFNDSSENKLKSRKLIVAAKMKNLQVALQAGFHYTQADTRQYDKEGNTPLYYAAKNGDEKICRFLLKLGADVNQACSIGDTPLHMAFSSGSISLVIDFLNHNGDLNSINNNNFTPLAFGSEQLLKKLNLDSQIVSISSRHLRKHDNNQLLGSTFRSSPDFRTDDFLTQNHTISLTHRRIK